MDEVLGAERAGAKPTFDVTVVELQVDKRDRVRRRGRARVVSSGGDADHSALPKDLGHGRVHPATIGAQGGSCLVSSSTGSALSSTSVAPALELRVVSVRACRCG